MSQSVVPNALRNLGAFMKDHQISFYNGLLILFTIAGEQIFKVSVFNCPCEQPAAKYYALIFFVCPFVVLFILGMVVSNLMWRICHGCWNRRDGREANGKTQGGGKNEQKKDGDKNEQKKDVCKNGFWKSLGYIMVVIARSLVVPTSWLFVTFLDGNYYACMLAEPPCDTTTVAFKNNVAYSQNIAWIGLASVIGIAFLVILCVRCCDSLTYFQYKFQSSYEELENKHLDNLIQEKTDKMAKENAKKFLDCEDLKKEDWHYISKSPDLKTCGEDRSNLSYLDQWVKEKNIQGVQQSSSEGTEVIRPPGTQEQQHGDAITPV